MHCAIQHLDAPDALEEGLEVAGLLEQAAMQQGGIRRGHETVWAERGIPKQWTSS
jgi:hypothetical protein